MNTFPSIEPVYAIAKDTKPLGKKTALGDGYGQSVRHGLNIIKPEWDVRWVVSFADASTIDLFLNQQSKSGEWFYWAPPDTTSPLKWRCDEWTVEHTADSLVQVSANFRQVFELSVVGVTPDPSTCDDDTICESDYGFSVTGNWSVWVAKLRDSESNVGYQAASCMDDKGYVYYAFYYENDIHVAKFTEGGVNLWVKSYPGRSGTPAGAYDPYSGNYQLHVVSATGEDRIIISQEANLATNSIPWYPYQTGALISIMAIDSVSGAFKWETLFTNGGQWQMIGENCYFDGIFVEYPLVHLRYDPNLKEVVHSARRYIQTTLSISGDLLTQTGYAVDNANMILTNVGTGKLGALDYTLVQLNGSSNPGFFLAPGHTGSLKGPDGAIGTPFSIYSTDPLTRSGSVPRRIDFLGNGQVFVYASAAGVNGYDEIMIVGANGQIVDHVRLTTQAPQLSFTTSFPFAADNVGGQYDLPAEPYWEVNFIRSASKIYLTGSIKSGCRVWEIDVTMSGSLITSINGISNRRQMISQSIYDRAFWGAMRYSSPNPAYNRVVVAGGRQDTTSSATYTAALMGFKRNINTLNQTINWNWNPSSPNTSTLLNPVQFSSDDSGFAVARDNLKLYVTTTVPYPYYQDRIMGKAYCAVGPESVYFLKQVIGTTVDRSAELIFDLYTYNT